MHSLNHAAHAASHEALARAGQVFTQSFTRRATTEKPKAETRKRRRFLAMVETQVSGLMFRFLQSVSSSSKMHPALAVFTETGKVAP